MTSSQNTANLLLEELRLNHLQGKKRKRLLDALVDHFNKVIILTLLGCLSQSQFEEFKKVINSSDITTAVEEVAPHVPGLMAIIEQRIAQELHVIKSLVD